jgi:pimeloyl-ACP methyl ester carboxylesterase
MEKLIEKTKSGMARAEYIEVEPNVRLHITDAGEGRPIILIHGWPLSDEMYEYQYNDLINAGFRAIGITLRGFGKSDKPYGMYNYDKHASDIKKVLSKLDIKDAVIAGFSMGGSIAIRCRKMDRIANNLSNHSNLFLTICL